MGADTIIMEWKQRLKKLREEPNQDALKNWQYLKELEQYMVDKGYQIHFNKVISPEGETLWKRH